MRKDANFTRWIRRLKAFTALNRITILFLGILIQACSVNNVPVGLKDITDVKQISTFQISGKIAFKSPQENKSATFYWQQNNQQYQILLNTYLGIQVANISGDNTEIKIKANGQDYQSNQPELLISQQLGWYLPLSVLPKWVKGEHNGVVMSRHENGLAKKVLVRTKANEEWIVEYLSYQSIGQLKLPKKLKCTAPQLTVILQINEWNQINQ